jgi:hypothetical protein
MGSLTCQEQARDRAGVGAAAPDQGLPGGEASMRAGEAIRLDREDIDMDEGLLVVRNSKFGLCRFLHNPNYVAFRIMSRRLQTVGPPRWRAWSLSRHNSARPTSGREM